MSKRIATWCAVAAMGVLGALMINTSAQAQSEVIFTGYQPEPINGSTCPETNWQPRDFHPEDGWVPAQFSGPVTENVAQLTKPSGDVGTSLETTNLGLAVTRGTTISVDVDLDEDASADAGAIRMFFYDRADADTATEAPTDTVLATGDGTLMLDVGSDLTIGTFGLTYDASNGSAGTVKFENLTVGEIAILFTECVQPSPSPSPSPTTSPSPEPTVSPTADPEPTTQPTDPADKPGLPVTGSKLAWLVGGGLGLLATGAGALGLTRLRRLRLR